MAKTMNNKNNNNKNNNNNFWMMEYTLLQQTAIEVHGELEMDLQIAGKYFPIMITVVQLGRFGAPRHMNSDQGRNFMSSFKHICQM